MRPPERPGPAAPIIVCAVALLTILTACASLQPLYGRGPESGKGSGAAIAVAPVAGHDGQLLRAMLERELAVAASPPRYRVETRLSLTTDSALPTSWPQANLSRLQVTARYRLLEIAPPGDVRELARLTDHQSISLAHRTHDLDRLLAIEAATRLALQGLARDMADRIRATLTSRQVDGDDPE